MRFIHQITNFVGTESTYAHEILMQVTLAPREDQEDTVKHIIEKLERIFNDYHMIYI